jgi:NAD(P)H-hydrate epimerase
MNMSQPLPMNRQQVRQVDRIAIEEYGIPGVVLMENAGRGATRAILDLLKDPPSSRVAILCGAGNNGGDGFVVARHLHNERVEVLTYLAVDPARLTGDTCVNYDIVRRMRLPIRPLTDVELVREASPQVAECNVVVDALLGTGFSGQVRSPLDAIISMVNALSGPQVVAIDLPSGLDCDSGQPSNATIRADVTVTFVAPKLGFGLPHAAEYVGRVVVVDIGAPCELIPTA